MSEMPISEADGHLSEVAHEAAEHGEVIYLMERGRRLAAVISAEAAATMEEAEDATDLALAEAARNEPGESIPLEQLRAELGL